MAIDLSSLTSAQQIAAIYIGYYDRAAEPAGSTFWEGILEGGTSLQNIALDFSTQDETTALYPFFTNPEAASAASFLSSVYLNLFGRAIEQAGLDFWTGVLLDPDDGVGVGDIIYAIIEGAEGDDETVVLNKIAVATDFTSSIEEYNTANPGSEIAGPTIVGQADDVLDGVDATPASVTAAQSSTDAFITANSGSTPTGFNELAFVDGAPQAGTAGADQFMAESGDFTSNDNIQGGAGTDVLTIFNEETAGVAVSARSSGLEQVYFTNQANDENGVADNNVGGYDNTVNNDIDVEIDGGRMVGVTRWEDFDSRADLVIEDARDGDDTDGTFTADLTVAMVSTDPGNVDYAVYFDGPVNQTTNNDTLTLQVIDQNNSSAFSAGAITGTTAGNLTDAELTQFIFNYNGTDITVDVAGAVGNEGDAHFGAAATYNDLVTAINNALSATAAVSGDVTAALSTTTFSENIGDDNAGAGSSSLVFGLEIVLTSNSGAQLGEATVPGDITVVSATDPADTAQSLTTTAGEITDLIRLNVELDDVGKGSMGGDAMFGAMSTGRTGNDLSTSDSIGIQQFDILVDRSSQLQTINSTNNSLEVVTVVNGSNTGINNTTTAADEEIGSLVVRGDQNVTSFSTTDNENPVEPTPGSTPPNATNNFLPGASPQQNEFGFSDVRQIDASAMVGAVDFTLDLTDEIVEKYLDIQDGAANGNTDDVTFDYDLGSNNDEFLVEMSETSLLDSGTGAREDFILDIDGNAGNDVITAVVGGADKYVDAQGQDYYELSQINTLWYQSHANDDASTLTIDGGAGNDVVLAYGYGNYSVGDGTGSDIVYLDNSGALEPTDGANDLLNTISRNITEHTQIDYMLGAAWSFNDVNGGDADVSNLIGEDNASLTVGTNASATAVVDVDLTVTFLGAAGAAGTGYTATLDVATYLTASTNAAIPLTTWTMTEQQLNQAIKQAINTDPVLSAVLEAVDGPGNSLVVYSKTDGEYVATDLDFAVTGTIGGVAITDPVTGSDYDTSVAAAAGTYDFENFGAASTSENDSTIRAAADGANDVYVLSTDDTQASTATAVLNGASNHIIQFLADGFGTDAVYNFDAGDGATGTTTAEDVFSFDSIAYVAGTSGFSNGAIGTVNTGNESISLFATSAAFDTAGEVADLFDAAAGTGTTDHIVIVYNAADDNTGIVYHVTDTAGANATAVVAGEIELVGTDWSTLALDNFA